MSLKVVEGLLSIGKNLININHSAASTSGLGGVLKNLMRFSSFVNGLSPSGVLAESYAPMVAPMKAHAPRAMGIERATSLR
jgi:hypothetical protein